MQFALAAAQMSVFEWDASSDVLTWFSTTGLGLNLEEAPTSGRAFFELVHPDDRQAVGESRARAISDRTDAVSEFRIIPSDGAIRWVRAHGRTVYDTDGKPLRILGVNADITDRKSLEEQLSKAHVQIARLRVLKATMRTVQDIVGNALMSLYMFRTEAAPSVSPQSLESFDRIVADTADRLKAIGDLEQVTETDMVLGPGVEYPGRPPTNNP
jgi:PAS domain S-box-containing protein